jgi:ABC transporter substrate binding protein (PQQ-dependent alcohol dehydrogenase system)
LVASVGAGLNVHAKALLFWGVSLQCLLLPYAVDTKAQDRVADAAATSPIGASAEPESLTVHVTYLSKAYREPEPLSLMQSIPTDGGVAGARLGAQEINITGGFLGRQYVLDIVNVPADADIAARAREVLAAKPSMIIADLDSADLLILADLPEAANAIILDARTVDDNLRQEECRRNLFHLLPSRAMRTDALAQFLILKRWRRWFILKGVGAQDEAYAAAMRRSAQRFGGKIVEERSYSYNPGARRVDTGFQQIQTQMPLATQSAPPYDVLVVADEADQFGDYLPYNTYEARPIVGTQGLVATAWHPGFQEYSALQMQHRFKLFAHRDMTERDYAGWLALRIVGEAFIRSGKTEAADLRAFLRSPQFEVAGFKGEGLTFRLWDQQLRQPVLLAQALMVTSMSPQDGFLHQKFLTDTLGFDEPETKCHLAP